MIKLLIIAIIAFPILYMILDKIYDWLRDQLYFFLMRKYKCSYQDCSNFFANLEHNFWEFLKCTGLTLIWLFIIGSFSLVIYAVAISPSNTPSTKKYASKKIGKNDDWEWMYYSKDLIRKRLKDPKSAKFKDVYLNRWNNLPVTCGYVNSRNSFGGYTGYKRFVASGPTLTALEEEMADFEDLWRKMCK